MDSDMMRHWGRRPVDNRPYGDDPEEEEETQQQQSLLARGLMTTIAEESSQDMQYLQTSHDGLVHAEEEEEEGNNDEDKEALRHQSSLHHHDNNINDKAPKEDNKDDADPPVGDHEQEGDNSSVPLHHSAFGQFAEDLMLNNSMPSPTGGKYRTVSVFGGVFAMPEDSVDSDNLSLSSASDGFSSEEDDDKPKRSPQRKAKLRRGEGLPNQTTTSPPPSKVATPRVVSPPSSPITEAPEKDTATSSPSSPLSTPPTSISQAEPNADTMATVQATTTTKDDSMARALEALDQTGSLLSKVLGELESSSSSSFPLHPQVMEQAMSSLQVSKQTLESAICLEDSVLSC